MTAYLAPFRVGVSNLGNTAGTTGLVWNQAVVVGGANITLSQSISAGKATITIIGGAGGGGGTGVAISAAGNSVSDQTVVFSNSNGLAFGMAGSTITGSYTVPTITNSSWTVSDNGTSGTVARLAFTNLNGVTLSLSTGAGGSHTIVGSHNGLTSQSNQNVTASNGGFAFQTLSFSNANGMSFGTSAGSAIFASYTVPTVTNSSWTVSDNGTSGTVARLAFTNLNGITLSLSTGAGGSHTIVGSHNALTSQSNQQMTLFATGNTTQSSTGTTNASSIIFRGEGNVSIGITNGSIVVSGAGGGGGNFSAGVSNLGNTAGSTGVTGTRLVFVGTNNITLSQSTDANGGTVSISGAGGGAGQFSAGVSTDGNTAGATGITGTQLVFVGTGPVSLSQTTGANGGTISIDAPATSSLVGTSGISISTNGSTISVIGQPFYKSRFNPFMEAVGVEGQIGQGTLHFHPVPDPDNFVFDRVLFDVRGTQATTTNSTGSFTVSFWLGFYTRNASSLSLLASSSTTVGASLPGTQSSATYNGPRVMSMGWTTTITQADLWVGVVSRTTSAGANMLTVSQYLASDVNSNFSGEWGVATNATKQNVLGLGVYTASTSGIPGSVAFSQINGTASQFLRVPLYYFLSQSA